MDYLKPFKIGNVTIDNPLILSPMEAVNDIAFRHMCKKYGAGVVSTEMVSANSLTRFLDSAIDLVQIHPEEHPVSTQLFGDDPTTLVPAAQMLDGTFETDVDLSRIKTDIVDLNVGCPSPKILAMGAGCALLKNTEKLRTICAEIAQTIDSPFTIKIRTGPSENQYTYKEITKICNETGVAALKVHGRTQKQMYAGKANYDIIKEVKELSTIPIIGNGDVFDEASAERMFSHTGCDGIMIGRGALGNPTIFKRIYHYFKTGEILPIPSKLDQIELFGEYLRFAKKYGIRDARLRQQALYFIRAFDGAAALRGKLGKCKNIEQMEDHLFGTSKESFSSISVSSRV